MEFAKFDLHMHSNWSDGAEPPEEVMKNAAVEGVRLLSLTDHDCTLGTGDAVKAGNALGLSVLPGVEMDTEWDSEVHILGLGIRPESPELKETLETLRLRRIDRNRRIQEKLLAAGMDISPYLKKSPGSTTRLNIALALVEGGYADNLRDAFSKYLRRGCPGYCIMERIPPEKVIGLIHSADGTAVWAHPCHLKGSVHEMLERMTAWGIDGLEAYHPSQTEGESQLLVSLANQKKLLVTCGSDSHGAHRPGVRIGCTFRDTPELRRSFEFFQSRAER